MTADQFKEWLKAMKANKRAKSDRQCGVLLGKTPGGIVLMKKRGTTITVALACAALLDGLTAYDGSRFEGVK